jgi:hypothetical protein
MYFDGSTSYLTAQTAAFATGTSTGDFTAECWAYPTALFSSATNSCTLLAVWNNGSTTGWQMYMATQGVGVRNNSSTIVTPAVAPTTGQWYHVALVRYGTTITVYVNGVATGSTTTAYTFTDNILSIGASNIGGAGTFFSGYIDDVRFTKGVARYTSNFNPPTSPFLNT